MTFDEDLRKELQQRLDPIGSTAEWEPVRNRMAGARKRRDRTRAALAGTVAASLVAAGVALVLPDGAERAPVVNQPSGSPTASPSAPTVGAPPAAVLTATTLPAGRTCPTGYRFFVNPLLRYDVCYPDNWTFVNEGESVEVLSAALLNDVHLLPDDVAVPAYESPLSPRIEILANSSEIDYQCEPTGTVDIVEGSAMWCEGDSASESGEGYLLAMVPLTQPHGSNDVLLFSASAPGDSWDSFRPVAFEMLSSLRLPEAPAPDELTLPLRLLSSEGSTLTFEARPGPCGGMDRHEVHETPTGVWVRAVGPRPITVDSEGRAIPCPLGPPEEFTVALELPVGNRTITFGLVSPEFGVQGMTLCGAASAGEPDQYVEAGDDAEEFASRDAALAAIIERYLAKAAIRDLIEYQVSGSVPADSAARGYLFRITGRTVGAFTVVRDGPGRGWRLGEIAYCVH